MTLTGIAERAHLLHAGVNWTHIADVPAELAVPDVSDAVLVGHSYGGMVITVSRIASEKGSARWCFSMRWCRATVNHVGTLSMTPSARGVDDTGYGVPPMPFFDPRATAHPLAAVLQRIKLAAELNRFWRRDFVYALDWPGDSPLRLSHDRVRSDANWTTHELDGKHNLTCDNPDDLLRILLDVERSLQN